MFAKQTYTQNLCHILVLYSYHSPSQLAWILAKFGGSAINAIIPSSNPNNAKSNQLNLAGVNTGMSIELNGRQHGVISYGM